MDKDLFTVHEDFWELILGSIIFHEINAHKNLDKLIESQKLIIIKTNLKVQ